MSYQFSNLSGSQLLLSVSGSPLYTVPVGYNGQLNVEGAVTVATFGQTNVVNVPTGQCVVNYDTFINGNLESQTQYDPPVTKAWGEVLQFTTSWGSHQSDPVPSVGSARLALVIDYDESATNIQSTWTQQGPNQGAYTNIIPGATLGTFEGGNGVRLVVAGISGVQTQTYATHFEMVGWGLALGVVVFGYRWLVNVIGSIGREQDL